MRARAEANGMRLVDYARSVLLNRTVAATPDLLPSRWDRLALEQLKRVGNNLNQIARQLNSQRGFVPAHLDQSLREVRGFIRKAAGDDS